MSQAGWENLDRIRRARVRASPSPDMRRLFLAGVPEMRRMRKQLAAVAAAWMEVLPAELAGLARLEGVTRGVLRVSAPDAATAFLIDRALREGGEVRLLSRTGVLLRGVRVTVNGVEDGRGRPGQGGRQMFGQ